MENNISNVDNRLEGNLESQNFKDTQDDTSDKGSITQQEQNLNLDERAREFQSRYDKLYSQHQNVLRDMQTYREKAQLLEEISNDPELLEAFVTEIRPDLIQKKDITQIVQERLRAEFGDYKPSRSEADEEPGGKAWLYFKRLDEIYNESKANIKPPQTVQQIKKQREEAIESEINKLKTQFKWDDTSVNNFRQWANSLNLTNLAKLYEFAIRTNRTPEALVQGGNARTLTAREKFLKTL